MKKHGRICVGNETQEIGYRGLDILFVKILPELPGLVVDRLPSPG